MISFILLSKMIKKCKQENFFLNPRFLTDNQKIDKFCNQKCTLGFSSCHHRPKKPEKLRKFFVNKNSSNQKKQKSYHHHHIRFYVVDLCLLLMTLIPGKQGVMPSASIYLFLCFFFSPNNMQYFQSSIKF